MLWRNPETRGTRSLLALGYNPEDPVFLNPDFAKNNVDLKLKGRVLFDELSRPEFGPIADQYREGRLVETEINGNRVRVAGLVKIESKGAGRRA